MGNRMSVFMGVVLGLVGAAALRTLADPPAARADTADSNSGWIGATGQVANGRAVLYLFDTNKKHLLVYDAPEGRTLRLLAARKCEYDAEVVDFVNGGTGFSEPTVKEIKTRIEKDRFGKPGEANKPK